jgi:hypothetical protein
MLISRDTIEGIRAGVISQQVRRNDRAREGGYIASSGPKPRSWVRRID